MKHDIVKMYFATNDQGKDLFYIELVYDPTIDFYFIKSSLNYNLYQHDSVKTLICRITEPATDSLMREAFMKELIAEVQTIPDITQYYFKDYLLDQSGKYMQFYDNTIQDILNEKELPCPVALSPYTNILFWGLFKEGFINKPKNEFQNITQSQFEEKINTLENLQDEYIKVYDSGAVYLKFSYREFEASFYLMLIRNEISFIVITEE